MDDSGIDHPIEAQIAAERLERAQQEAACIAAIKAVQAAGPTLMLGKKASRVRRVRGGLLITKNTSTPKFSPSGRFLGWYTPDQRRGMPNSLTWLEQCIETAYTEREKTLRGFVSRSDLARTRGKKSGSARMLTSIALQIPLLRDRLVEEGVPKHKLAKQISDALGSTPKYVRGVLHDQKKRGAK